MSRYENDLREPKAELIAKIADALHISCDFLLGRADASKNPQQNEESYSTFEKLLIRRFRNLSEKGQIQIFEQMEEMLQSHK